MPTTADHHQDGHVSPGSSLETPSGSSKTRHKVSRACNSCRKSKKKCNGELPCQQCVAQQTPDICVYGSNGRSNPRHKRILQDAEEERDHLKELLQAMRNLPDAAAAELFLRIRLGHSIEDLLTSVRSKREISTSDGVLTNAAEGPMPDGIGIGEMDEVNAHIPEGSFSDWLRLDDTAGEFGLGPQMDGGH